MLEGLAAGDKVTGLKQTRRAIEAGMVRCVYLACDADPRLTEPVRQLCAQRGVAVEEGCTLAQLGRAAGIAVGTAAVALLAK
ncbi:MAG: 50S ribosomal protein L7ae-like protein [Ruminococcaceae bacterium]|nr:50S ribosomal protein L7ae-like protein [Oscillospiraceae bacterium]